MDEARKAFMAATAQAYKQQKRLQKSDDIITWIEENWKLFCSNKQQMTAAVSQLGQQVPYSVDSLCDLLAIPQNVYFKRSPVADIGGTLLNFEKSKLLDLFLKCMIAAPTGEACLFVVAGKKSICITNMQTNFENCTYEFWYRDCVKEHIEVHVFRATEVNNRLPNLFNKEEYYG